MFRLAAIVAAAFSLAAAIAQAPPPPPPLPPPTPAIEVPTFANPTCPIMGKKVSMPLFIDTDLGRFYVCCKPCYKKIRADVPAAHKTAYPVVQELKNETCPVSGEPIGDLAIDVTLQGYRFRVCCSGCVATARQHSQVTLAKLTRKNLVDVANATCPITGGATVANAFVVLGDALVHLSSPKAVEEVAKDPSAALQKARAIAAAQPPRPKHEHQSAVPKGEPAKDEPAKEGK